LSAAAFATHLESLPGVQYQALLQIPGELGAVYRGIKCTDESYAGFGEAYFSSVLPQAIKGWKLHQRMVSTLICPVGLICVSVYCEKNHHFAQYWLGEKKYARLSIPPGLHYAFAGLGPALNLLLNVASIAHDPSEASTSALSDARFAGINVRPPIPEGFL
jgi:dTDP-4-dehydrorhamnose 3,5-epimerase